MNNSLRHKLPLLAALARTRPFRLWLARCASIAGGIPPPAPTLSAHRFRHCRPAVYPHWLTHCVYLHIIDTLERQRLSGRPVLLILHTPVLEPRLQTLLYSYIVWFRLHHPGFQAAIVCPDRRWLRCKDSPAALQALHASANYQLHTCGWQTPDRLRGLCAEHIYCWGLPAPAVTPILRAALPQLSMTAHSLLIIHTTTAPTGLDPDFWPILTHPLPVEYTPVGFPDTQYLPQRLLRVYPHWHPHWRYSVHYVWVIKCRDARPVRPPPFGIPHMAHALRVAREH